MGGTAACRRFQGNFFAQLYRQRCSEVLILFLRGCTAEQSLPLMVYLDSRCSLALHLPTHIVLSRSKERESDLLPASLYDCQYTSCSLEATPRLSLDDTMRCLRLGKGDGYAVSHYECNFSHRCGSIENGSRKCSFRNLMAIYLGRGISPAVKRRMRQRVKRIP